MMAVIGFIALVSLGLFLCGSAVMGAIAIWGLSASQEKPWYAIIPFTIGTVLIVVAFDNMPFAVEVALK